ncbi:hypothetical protein KO566_04115 [Flavobacteriaceae bacterium XHP0103]|uniref:hypothetical protein n=1 Tax=Marixanthotalea marina TaxID=2844359 RepID=UPI002989AF6E|nr:hypothetical protein [Marixanthotalea marina]MBU3821236.1 hypothetical protein [Marixanthotalea marina]
MSSVKTLLNKIENAEALDFGEILGDSLSLFKKTWLQGFVFFLIAIIALIPFFAAIYMPIYKSVLEEINNGADPSQLSSLNMDSYRLMVIGLGVIISFFMVPLTASFYRIVKKIDFGGEFNFKDFFYFFKNDYLMKIATIVSLTVLVSLINYGFEKTLPEMYASILSIALSLVFNVLSLLMIVFMAFNPDLDSYAIINLAFSLGLKKGLVILGLIIVAGIIGGLGIIACGIGMMFTFSIVYLPIYHVYKKVFGFNETSDIDKIGVE